MTSPTAFDLPEVSTSADLTLVTRGLTITASIERADELGLVVRPTSGGHAGEVGVKPGDPVELYWRAGYEERTLPAKITEIEDGLSPSWRLRATGPAERSQRRKAVRAWVELPVTITCNTAQLTGHTVDLSEAGVRVLVDGWGAAPGQGHAGTRDHHPREGLRGLPGDRRPAHGSRSSVGTGHPVPGDL